MKLYGCDISGLEFWSLGFSSLEVRGQELMYYFFDFFRWVVEAKP